MQLPKKIHIANRPWKVVKDNRIAHSSFSYRDMKIHVGHRGNSSREILSGFLHEVAEISCCERGVRASKERIQDTANDCIFVATHDTFSDVILDVSEVVGNMMRLR